MSDFLILVSFHFEGRESKSYQKGEIPISYFCKQKLKLQLFYISGIHICEIPHL